MSSYSDDTIYVLGAGFVGCLTAYELSTIETSPEIVLLFRNEEKLSRFEKSDSQLTIFHAPDGTTVKTKLKASCPSRMKEKGSKISKLIVSTKTYQTKSALADYLHLIGPSTDIVFIQNGLGVVDIIHNEIWTDVATRPRIFQGVTNHGGFKTPNVEDEFHYTHAGYGDLKIALVPNDSGKKITPEEFVAGSVLISELMKPVILKTTCYEYSDLLVIQIEKFAVNACINSITSIVDCVNGELNPLPNTLELFRKVIAELVDVFFKTMPSLTTNRTAEKILNVDRLVEHVINVGTVMNAKNSSSMRQDCLNLRTTEIDFINGYVVKVAEQNGLRADVNSTITLLVKTRLALNRSREAKEL